MLTTQSISPDFTSPNQDNQPVQLADFRNKKNVLLYFYPKDDTPGCTIEANDFTRLVSEFAQLDTVVIGISKDSCQSHVDFINKYGIQFDLLADSSGEVCEKFMVWQEKEKDGIKKMGIVRSTFFIDKNGTIQIAEYNVNPKGHAQAMLERVKNII